MKLERIAIIGATGLVGQHIFSYLHQCAFSYTILDLFASKKSVGKTLTYQDKIGTIQDIEKINFSHYDLVFFATSNEISKLLVPIALKNNCYVIDNSSYFRMYKEVPLLLPCVNFSQYKNEKLIANPNCATAILCNAIAPMNQLYPIKKIVVSTYQSISGIGQNAVDDFIKQNESIFNHLPYESTYDLALNNYPLIGHLSTDGYTEEENKIIRETQKIFNTSMEIYPTCVRTPTLFCHGESVYLEFSTDIDKEKILETIENFKDLDYCLEGVKNRNFQGQDGVVISRLRFLTSKSISFYILGDNLLKGAASNAVNIAQSLKEWNNDIL